MKRLGKRPLTWKTDFFHDFDLHVDYHNLIAREFDYDTLTVIKTTITLLIIIVMLITNKIIAATATATVTVTVAVAVAVAVTVTVHTVTATLIKWLYYGNVIIVTHHIHLNALHNFFHIQLFHSQRLQSDILCCKAGVAKLLCCKVHGCNMDWN